MGVGARTGVSKGASTPLIGRGRTMAVALAVSNAGLIGLNATREISRTDGALTAPVRNCEGGSGCVSHVGLGRGRGRVGLSPRLFGVSANLFSRSGWAAAACNCRVTGVACCNWR